MPEIRPVTTLKRKCAEIAASIKLYERQLAARLRGQAARQREKSPLRRAQERLENEFACGASNLRLWMIDVIG